MAPTQSSLQPLLERIGAVTHVQRPHFLRLRPGCRLTESSFYRCRPLRTHRLHIAMQQGPLPHAPFMPVQPGAAGST